MKSLSRSLFAAVLCAAIFLFPVVVNAQSETPAVSRETRIKQLRGLIKNRQESEGDENTPTRMRDANRAVLEKHNLELRELLLGEIAAYLKHQERLGDGITEEEKTVIDDALNALRAERENLRAATQTTASRATVSTPESVSVAPSAALNNKFAQIAATDTPSTFGASDPGVRRDLGMLPVKNGGESSPLTAETNSSTAVVTPTASAKASESSQTASDGLGDDTKSTPPPPPEAQPVDAVESKELLEGYEENWKKIKPSTSVCFDGNPEKGIRKKEADLTPYQIQLCRLVDDVQNVKRNKLDLTTQDGRDVLFDLRESNLAQLATFLVARKGREAFITDALNKFIDRQLGSVPSSVGSTSLTVRGAAPSALGISVENGAFDQTNSGSTLTLRGNFFGLGSALSGQGYVTSYDLAAPENNGKPLSKFLRKAAFGATFNVNRDQQPGDTTSMMATPMPTPMNGGISLLDSLKLLSDARQQLSSFSLRYEFHNSREPREDRYRRRWNDLVAGKSESFFPGFNANLTGKDKTMADALVTALKKDLRFRRWIADTQMALSQARNTGDSLEEVLATWVTLMPIDDLSPETLAELARLESRINTGGGEQDAFVEEIGDGGIATFEFTGRRGVNSPDTSNMRFIIENGMLGGKANLIGNASATLFNTRPLATTVTNNLTPIGAARRLNRFRDFQFAGQFDVPIPKVANVFDLTFSAALRYERLAEDLPLDTFLDPLQRLIVATNTKGDVGIAQAKITLRIPNTEIEIPFSFSYSNRTELIKESELRGNFGFSYNLDALFRGIRR